MKFHTCNHHCLTWWKRSWKITHIAFTFSGMGKKKKEKSSWKINKEFGSLEMGANCAQVFISRLSTYAVNVGWKRVSPFEIYNEFKTWKYSLWHHLPNMWKITPVAYSHYLCAQMLMGNGIGTPNLKWFIIYKCGFEIYQFHRSQNHALVRKSNAKTLWTL